MSTWISGITKILVTISEILTAGIAVTAFSLLLYALTFNLKDRVARSFVAILFCVVIVFSAEALGSTAVQTIETDFWLHVQWVGIIFLPAAYLHFSDALLSTTGQPSRWRRRWAVRVTYFIAILLLFILPTRWFLGPVIIDQPPAPHNQPTILTEAFTIYYLTIMVLAWVNFVRAFRRTVTQTSRRRMSYLTFSALAPALGSFPFLLYSSSFASQQTMIFWLVSIAVNLITGGLIVVMAYAVAFFGVPWPDRVVKSRLIKWLLRGPLTASLTLALVTLIRRAGDAFGNSYSALVPIVMIVTILLCEYLITLFFPKVEQLLLFGNDQQELIQLRSLEERLITRSDLSQFLEMILAAVCDQFQASGAYLVTPTQEGLEMINETGGVKLPDDFLDTLQSYLKSATVNNGMIPWDMDMLLILKDGEEVPELVGYLGIQGFNPQSILDEEVLTSVQLLIHRAAIALRDREIQEQVFHTLEKMDPQVEMIQQLRAAGRYDRHGVLMTDDKSLERNEMAQWIKDALTHYWGGPKLTENPLVKLKIVTLAMDEHENNPTNALRSVLKEAIDKIRPDGDRKYTGEWILYNILDLKFLEGKKVREIAMRLAVSEADLYRKQRVAIDAVTNEIVQMEMLVNDEHH